MLKKVSEEEYKAFIVAVTLMKGCALEAGTKVEKINLEEGDATATGTKGIILGGINTGNAPDQSKTLYYVAFEGSKKPILIHVEKLKVI